RRPLCACPTRRSSDLAEKMADLLETWAQAWGRDVVVDTHPGGVSSTMGAMAAARSILVPNLFEEKPMEGLEGLLEQLGRTYPLLDRKSTRLNSSHVST